MKNKYVTKFVSEFKGLLIAIILAVLFRSILFEPYLIPSGSMIPTLLVGDRVFISKYEYGFSDSSFPFNPPLFNGRVLELKQPQRGDVVVFEHESNGRETSMLTPIKHMLGVKEYTQYVKRLIGLPGDRIQVIDSVLYINDTAIPRVRIDDATIAGERMHRYVETLPNGISYTVLDSEDGCIYDNTGIYVVPEGHYFFMGDNRDNSRDSRDLTGFGYVSKEYLLGKVQIIFFSTDASLWNPISWFTELRYKRLFKMVR